MIGAPIFDASDFAAQLDRVLRAACSAERADHEARYLKSTLGHYGVGVPTTRAAVKSALRHVPQLGHDDLIGAVETLWESPVHELRLAAIEMMTARSELLSIEDRRLIERLLRESRTWALVDPLAIGVVGPLAERSAAWGEVLDRWAGDDDFWIRRASLLTLLVPLRRGEGDWERFARYADSMLDESEFFIRKAIGWVLRDTGKRRPDLVFDWLLPHAQQASGVTLREALKPLSPAQQQAIRSVRA